MLDPLLFFLVAASVTAAIWGAVQLMDANGYVQSRIKRRLKEIGGGDPAVDYLRRRMLGEGVSPWLARLLDSTPLRWFDHLVSTSGLNIMTERLILAMVLGLPLALTALNLLRLKPAVSIPGAVI